MGIQQANQKDNFNEPEPYDELDLKDDGSDAIASGDRGIADEDFDEEDIADADGVAVIDDESDLDDEGLQEDLEEDGEEEQDDDTVDSA